MTENGMVEFFTASDFDSWQTIETKHVSGYISKIANRILSERGVVVYGSKVNGRLGRLSEVGADSDTHTALLVGVTPIAHDTAESLIRELVKGIDSGGFQYGSLSKEFLERARRVLGAE